MNIEQKIELLQKIKRVDAPPFLFTRIEAKLSNNNNEIPFIPKWAFVLSSSLILSLNVFVFTANKSESNSIVQVGNSMKLTVSNNLYNE